MKSRRTPETLAAAGAILLLVGCAAFQAQHAGSPAPEPISVSQPAAAAAPAASGSATLARVQTEIFTPKCAIPECHITPAPGTEDKAPEGLILENGKSHALIVGVKAGEVDAMRIAPGNPDASYLLKKVTPGAKIAWHAMPLDKPKLSDAERQLIRDWVVAGAKND